MPVYVDGLCNYGWKYGPSCHLYADTLEELHEFAGRIGMKRDWFQTPERFPHYDLTAKRRNEAVKLGAIEHTRKEFMAWRGPLSAKVGGG